MTPSKEKNRKERRFLALVSFMAVAGALIWRLDHWPFPARLPFLFLPLTFNALLIFWCWPWILRNSDKDRLLFLLALGSILILLFLNREQSLPLQLIIGLGLALLVFFVSHSALLFSAVAAGALSLAVVQSSFFVLHLQERLFWQYRWQTALAEYRKEFVWENLGAVYTLKKEGATLLRFQLPADLFFHDPLQIPLDLWAGPLQPLLQLSASAEDATVPPVLSLGCALESGMATRRSQRLLTHMEQSGWISDLEAMPAVELPFRQALASRWHFTDVATSQAMQFLLLELAEGPCQLVLAIRERRFAALKVSAPIQEFLDRLVLPAP